LQEEVFDCLSSLGSGNDGRRERRKIREVHVEKDFTGRGDLLGRGIGNNFSEEWPFSSDRCLSRPRKCKKGVLTGYLIATLWASLTA